MPATLLHKQTLQLSRGEINDFRRLQRINEFIHAKVKGTLFSSSGKKKSPNNLYIKVSMNNKFILL